MMPVMLTVPPPMTLSSFGALGEAVRMLGDGEAVEGRFGWRLDGRVPPAWTSMRVELLLSDGRRR